MNSLPSLNHKTSEDVTVGVRVESFVGVVRYGIVPTVPGEHHRKLMSQVTDIECLKLLRRRLAARSRTASSVTIVYGARRPLRHRQVRAPTTLKGASAAQIDRICDQLVGLRGAQGAAHNN